MVFRNRRSHLLLAIALAATLGIGCFLTFSGDPEPTYEGRPLSEWLVLHAERRGKLGPGKDDEKPAEAIRHIGTNALPCLLTWLDYEPSALRIKLGIAVQKLPQWIWQSRPVGWLFSLGDAPERAENARDAFDALGPIAAPAIPELARRSHLTNTVLRKPRAIYALACIGREAMPTMIELVSGSDQAGYFLVLDYVGKLGTNARPLVPLLIPHLQSTNWFVAMITTSTLGKMRFDSDLVVPALTKCMDDSRHEVRMEAPLALMQFGELARPALPALVKALGDSNADVRRNAAKAVNKLAPETLTNAPPK